MRVFLFFKGCNGKRIVEGDRSVVSGQEQEGFGGKGTVNIVFRPPRGTESLYDPVELQLLRRAGKQVAQRVISYVVTS